ncbi:MAG: hypothetical protein ACYSUI_25725 [Planctomycetota bacterium]
MDAIARVGQWTAGQWWQLCYLSAVTWQVLVVALRPRTWTRTVRCVLARQILRTGVLGIRSVLLVALLVGVAVVLQAQLWLARV